MSASPSESDAEEPKHSHDHGRWAVPYGDMLTVLMALFIVLYAMSSVDEGKYEQLAASLAEGFNSSIELDTTEQTGVEKPEPVSPEALAEGELSELLKLQAEVDADLAANGLAGTVEYQISERGLVFKLIGSDLFFDPNSANLTAGAHAVISTIAPHLAALNNQVSIEGHADKSGNPFPYATDWELSGDRAVQVARYLTESGHIAANRLGATAYSSARPATGSATEAEREQNRRVDIVFVSDESDAVRQIVAEMAGGSESKPSKGSSGYEESGGH